jgi:hypothetical protein
VFVSWAHDDKRAKTAVLTPLRTELTILAGIEIEWWDDSDIVVGALWRQQIADALADCDYGVLLISPAFLASAFVTAQELPHFVGPLAAKGALPVGLQRVPLDGSRNTQGVEDHQIFTSRGRFFTETRDRRREEFVRELASMIQRRILADA